MNKPKKRCSLCGAELVVWSTIAPRFCPHCTRRMKRKTPKPPKRKPRKTTIKTGPLDVLWSKLVRHRAGNRCEYCGSTKGLNAHHIFSRANYSTRWDIDNGVSVCVAHHVFGNDSFHKAPIEMLEWIKSVRGQEWYDALRVRASDKTKTITELKELAKHKLKKLEEEYGL